MDRVEQQAGGTPDIKVAVSEIFGFESPVPCLLIKRHSYNRRDVMVEYVEGLFRGDAYTYRLRLDI